eukprot:5348326-Prymnesium_polylepis.1
MFAFQCRVSSICRVCSALASKARARVSLPPSRANCATAIASAHMIDAIVGRQPDPDTDTSIASAPSVWKKHCTPRPVVFRYLFTLVS